jgi:CHC2 zinc finger
MGSRSTHHNFEEILQRARELRLEAVIARHSLNLRKQGAELVGACPVCGEGDDRFAVHLGKGKWNCRQCKRGGSNAISLERFLSGSDFKTAVRVLVGHAGTNVVRGLTARPEPRRKQIAVFPYPDESGKILFETVRYHYENADGSLVFRETNRRRTFYNAGRIRNGLVNTSGK